MKKAAKSGGLRRQMSGPGKAASKVKPKPAGGNFQGGDASFSPKGLKTYSNSKKIKG